MKFDKLLMESLMIGAGIVGAGTLIRYLKEQQGMEAQTASVVPLAVGLVAPQLVKGKQAKQLRPLILGAMGVGIASFVADMIKGGTDEVPGIPVVSIGAGYNNVSRGNYQALPGRPDLARRIR